MKILIVDDEAPARERLKALLLDRDAARVVLESDNGVTALTLVQSERPDTVLLDIRMPGMDGLEAAMHMARLEHPPSIIFTTAYDDRALEAFEARAVDYLLKPVRAERLEDALLRAGALTRGHAAMLRHADPAAHPRAYIGVSVRGGLELVPVAEIRYFRAEHKYVFAGRGDRETLLDESLKALEAEFAGRFLRIHRSALVARDYVERVERRADGALQVWLRGVREPLPVSRRHGAAFRKALRESAVRR